MKAQGFLPALSKFNPDQLRVPAGNGRESRRWSTDAGSPEGIMAISFSFPAGQTKTRKTETTRNGGSGAKSLPRKTSSTNVGSRSFLGGLRRRRVRPAYPKSSRLDRSNRISRDRAREKKSPFQGCPIPSREPMPPNVARQCRTTTDLTRSEFETTLSQSGWAKVPSPDGKAMNYTKDGAKYSVRDDQIYWRSYRRFFSSPG
jgi:hypothetical protein